MNPRITVVIPVLEHRAELRECLRSLERQTEQSLEITIIDDGSKDKVQPSDTVCAFPTELIRFDKNKGAPSARNIGLDRAKGDFIIFLDADTDLVPDALETMMQALQVHTDASFAYPNFRFGAKSFIGKPFDKEALRQQNYIHTSALIRHSDAIRFDESLKKFQDWDYFLQLAEQGKKGIWINRELMSFKERTTGISRWLPTFAYDIPWRVIGWMPKRIKQYFDADNIIREKHHLQSRPVGGTGEIMFHALWLGVLTVGALLARIFPEAQNFITGIVCLLYAWVAFRSPAHSMSFIIAEYLIGSKGGMLKFGANEVNDGGVGIRQWMLLIFLAAWIWNLRKEISIKLLITWLKQQWIYPALGIVLVYAFIRGMVIGNSFAMSDANGWGVLLMAIPFFSIAQKHAKELWKVLRAALVAGLCYLFLLSFALFYLYSHRFVWLQDVVYLYIRRSGIGEITRILEDGSLYRIFIQSHIYVMLLFAFVLWNRTWFTTKQRIGLLALSTAVILLSLSRSFFAAVGIVVGIWLCTLPGWKRLFETVVAGVLGILLVVGIVFFPIPWGDRGDLDQALLSRFDSSEAAAQSRWILLPALKLEINKHPVLGSGFGKTVTYKSADPRVAATGKAYTTYAFEWGWHDLWLKLGAGVLVVIGWFIVVMIAIFRSTSATDVKWGMAMVLVALVVTHIFTPYVNHPLGLLVLMLTLVYTHSKNSLYEKTPLF